MLKSVYDLLLWNMAMMAHGPNSGNLTINPTITVVTEEPIIPTFSRYHYANVEEKPLFGEELALKSTKLQQHNCKNNFWFHSLCKNKNDAISPRGELIFYNELKRYLQGLDYDIANPILTFAVINDLFCGQIGSDLYSEPAKLLFYKIKTLLTNNIPIIASTLDRCMLKDLIYSDGLVGGHAYTILDAHGNPEYERCCIKLFNPWGKKNSCGCDYKVDTKNQKLIPYTTKNGIFLLDFLDFVQRFKAIEYSSKPIPIINGY